MKKLYFLLAFLVLASVTGFGQVIFSETFEEDTWYQNWTMLDQDNDNHDWSRVLGPNIAYEGQNCAFSASFESGTALSPDNWLVTTPIQIEEPSTLSFMVRSMDAPGEHYAVYIATPEVYPNVQNFELLVQETVAGTGWVNVTVNIPAAYVGNWVLIAFRHFNTVGQNWLLLDNVEVAAGSAEIQTMGVSNLTPTSADVMGYIDPTLIPGYSSSQEIYFGFYCATTPNPGPGDPCIYRTNNYLEEAVIWYHNIPWLQEQTTYYVRAFYRFITGNDTLVGFGNELSFTTPACASSNEQYVSACDMYVVESTTTLLREGFENLLPAGWTLVDADGDNDNWAVREGSHAHTGGFYIASESYSDELGTLTPENWLITPAIAVPDTGVTTLSWWVGAQDPSWYYEYYQVRISTNSTDLLDFNAGELFYETLSSPDWQQRSVSLAGYAGQTVYIAFVHSGSDQYWLNIDDIEVTHSNALVYSASGDYTCTYTNQYGCDSVVTLHLNIMQNDSVATYPVEDITSVSASMGGYLELLCGDEQPQLGVCYSTSPNPTIDDMYIFALQGGDMPMPTSFMQPVEGLSANTTYYVRVFGITSTDTIYGQEETFTTLEYASLSATVTSDVTGLPIADAEVMISVAEAYYEGDQLYWYRGEMISDTLTDSDGHFTVNSIVMSDATEKVFLDLWADGYQHRMYIVTLYPGNNIRNYTMLLEPCYEVPYRVYWEELNDGNYQLSWWSMGYAPGDSIDPQYNYQLTYNVYENGNLIAEGLTNRYYMLPSFNANSCYQVRSICPNSSISDTSECATIKPVLPVVVTNNVSEITGFTAVLSGEITFDGNSEIYSYGFYVNTIPTLDSGNVMYYYLYGDSYTFSQELQNLSPETTYYVWAYAVNEVGVSMGDMQSFTTTRACYTPVAFQVSDVMASSALLTWNDENEDVPAYYELSYKTTDADSWTVVSNITNHAYLLSGLQEQTAYMVRIRTFCEAGLGSPYTSLSFSTNCIAGTPTVTIGEGSIISSGGVLPTNIFYQYSYTQQIYQSNEIGSARTINNIGLQYFYTTAYSRNLDIYLVHTNKTSFTSNNDWISVAGVQPVFSGYVTFSNAIDGGWVNIPLTTPFEYNGSDNVVLVVNDKTGSYYNSGEKFYTHSTSQYSSIYAYRDGSAYNVTNPSSGSRSYYRNHLRIPGICLSEGCDRSNVAVVNVSENTAQLAIAAGNGIQAVELEYKAENANEYTPLVVQGDSYTLTGLTPYTNYEVRVRSLCTEDTTDWKTVNFTTLVTNMDRLYVKTGGAGDGSSWEQATNDLSLALTMARLIREDYGNTPEIWVAEGTYYGDGTSVAAFTMVDGVNVYGGFAGNETDLSQRDYEAHPTILDGQNTQRVLYQPQHFTTVTTWDGFTLQHGHAVSISSVSAHGGGAYLYSNSVLRHCQIINNSAAGAAGGAYVYALYDSYPNTLIDSCYIAHNTATNYAGGIYATYAKISHSTITENTSGGNGGGLYISYASLNHCVITHNTANGSYSGGGLYYYYGGANYPISNCLIAHNTAGSGGGFYGYSSGYAQLFNTTIVGNTANSYYGGAYIRSGSSMTNCVIWGNHSNNTNDNVYIDPTMQNCAIEGMANNAAVINLSSDNVGTDENANYPVFVSPDNDDYRLRAGSVLINAGVMLENMPLTDLAGESRVFGDTVEIGCYEFHNEEFCSCPSHLQVSQVMGTSAMLTWRNGNIEEPAYYELSYKADGDADWTVLPEQIHNTYKMLAGLQEATTYMLRMRAFCPSGQASDYSQVVIFATLGTSDCLFDANGDAYIQGSSLVSTNGGKIPSNFYFNYSISQQIYQASEFVGGGVINSLAFQYFYSGSQTRNLDIYMGHTSKTSFESGNDWVPVGDMTLVYSGSITFSNSGTNNWYNINLQNNFEYNGNSNLVLMVVDKTGSYTNSNNKFYTNEAPVNNSTLYLSSDGTLYNPSSITNYSGNMMNYRNNLRLHGQCTSSDCARSNLAVIDVTSNSAKLVFAPSTDTTAIELQYGVAGSDNYETLPTQGGEYTLTGLRYNTTYEARIRSVCGENTYSPWKTVVFTTPLVNMEHLYVAVNGTGDASSWENAANDLAWAMNTAALIKQVYGTTAVVWVAEGTYYGGAGDNAFTMVDGVDVYGGFAGNETELSQRDYTAHPTILDGQNTQRVLYQPTTFDERTVWDGFILQHGNTTNFSSNSNNNCGGGAFLRGNGVLRHCTIINNAGYNGGGVYSNASYSYNSELVDCKVMHNTASYNGAGVYSYYMKVRYCEISYNKSTSGSGAGVYVYYSNTERDVISNCLIANNTSYSGAGVYVYNNATILNSTIVNNNATNNAAGVYGNGTVQIANSIIWGNRANGVESNLYNYYNCQNCAVEGTYSGTNMISLLSEPNPSLPYYPNFVNPSQTVGNTDVTANVDWHLADGSICVNWGDNDKVLVADSLDMDGNVRIQMGTVDLGCYESAYNGITLPTYNGIVYVKENGTGDGTSWANAMSSLSDALIVAVMSDLDVWVAAGTYYGDSISPSAFVICEGVNVYGGFAGNEPADYDLSLRDFTANATILDGQQNQRVIGQNTDFTTRTVWDGFVLQNGYAHQDANYTNYRTYGGGAFLKAGMTLRNCVIKQNRAVDYGGGVSVYHNNYYNSDTTFLINCEISHNTTNYIGGGAYLYGNTVANNCVFSYNKSQNSGGGVYGDQMILSSCLVANNTANGGSGGGVNANSSNGVIRNSTIVNNEFVSTSSYDNGAGLYLNYATITNCIVWGNKTSTGMVSGVAGYNYIANHVASDNSCDGNNNMILVTDNNSGILSPNFVNPSTTVGYADETENVDWHLQQGSPCVNRGDNSMADAYDLDGNARVQMDTIDLGCYESSYNGVSLPVYNGIVYVKQNGAGAMTGASWEDAMPSIQSALNVAFANNAVVWVAAGTYHAEGSSVNSGSNNTSTVSNAFVMKQGVSVYGGFVGNEAPDYDLSLRDFSANASVLDGEYSHRVLYQPSEFTENTAVVWDGFTIQNGRVNSNGAGVYMCAYSTIRNCTVQYNYIASTNISSTSRYGAGVYAYGSGSSKKAVVSHCKISYNGFENMTYGYAAGIYTYYTEVDHTEISHNNASRDGAGVYVNYNSIFSNCLIFANTAQHYGGGVYFGNSYDFNMVNCDIVNNTAISSGGGIYNGSNNDAPITNSIVWGNKQGYVVNNFNNTSMTNVTYCAVEGGYQGEGNIDLASTNDGNDGTAYYVRFIDPQHDNYQLHPTSSCVNIANMNVVTDSLDFYGNLRMIGDGVDMGCSEVQNETSCISVVNLTASNITTNSAQLSWQPRGTETQWVVMYGEADNDESFSLTVNNDPTCTLQGLTFNRQYSARVRAICDDEMMSVFSIPVNFQTTCDPSILDTLPNFSNMTPEDNNVIYNHNVAFSWAAMEHATSYDFYLWKTTENEPSTPTRSGLIQPNLAYTVPGYAPGVSYNWKVVAWNECISKTSAVMTLQANYNPDLHVSAINTSTPVSTQPMTVTWTVTNDGQGNTPPGSEWYDYIWLTPVDGIGDGFWYNVSEVKLATVPSLNGLNAGESYTNSVEVTIPEGYIGSYYLFVLADQPNVRDINYGPTGGSTAPDPYTPSADGNPYPYLTGTVFHFYTNNVAETTDADNFFYKVITILPPPSPDLVVSSVVHGGDALSGHEANVTWTVTNQGEAAAMGSWIDAVYLSSDTLLDTEDDLRIGRFVYEGPLAINESYQRTEQFTIPVDYNGDYYFIVLTDNNNTVYEGLQELNNKKISAPMHVTLSWFTDLEVTNVTMTETVDANGSYACSYTVVNNGASPTNVNWWNDAIYISEDPVLDMNNARRLYETSHYGFLNIYDEENPLNYSYQKTVNISIPADITGNWYLHVVVDVDNDVFEYNAENNNIYTYQPALTVLNPDLTVTNIVLPDVIDPNEPSRIQWTVRNDGPGNVVGRSFTDKFYINGNQIYYAAVTHIDIPVGDSIVRFATVNIPCVNTAELTITTDVSDAVSEAVETNNSMSVNLQISTPDFVVRNVSPVTDNYTTNDYLWSGTPAELSYTVANQGQTTASISRMMDKIYFSASSDSYQASDLIYTNIHEVNLTAGDSATYTCAVTIPNGISGTYYYHVVCNVNDTICEAANMGSNENVSEAVEVMLSPSPDLVITNVTVPTQVYIGAGFEVLYTIKNQGEAAVNGMVAQKFYYSLSPTSYNSQNLLATINNYVNLNVNDSVSNMASMALPANITPGVFYIHAIADADDQVYEHNHENNNRKVSNLFNALTYELDLQLTQIEGPDVMQWGETAICTLHVHNNSSLPTLASSWRDVIYLSSDNVLHSTDQLMQASRHSAVVAGGADYEVPIEVTIPFGTPATAYLIGVTDFDNNNPDVNLNNNVLMKQLTINTVPTPDLAVSDVVVLDDIYAGQSARLAYKVTNVGEITISDQTWNDKLFASYNDTYENTDVQLLNKDRRRMTMAPNDFYVDTLTFTVPLPNNGHMYLLMMANASNNPFEAVSSNNMEALPVEVILPLPGDLVVTEVSCENSVVSGQTLHASWTIQNIGDNTLMGRGLRSLAYVSADTVFDANDRLLGSVTTTSVSLGVDATLQQSLESRISGLSPGYYYLIVKTDVTNAFNEVSDANNTGHSLYPFEVTIRPLPFNTNVYDTISNNVVSDYMLNIGNQVNQTVRIHVASEDSLLGAVNMIYATYNAMGDNLNYSYSTIGQYVANSELYIPSTQSGYYGVNIYGSTPTNMPQNTIVRADILPFELRAVNDDHGGNTGVVTVELTGSRFRPDMTVTMRRGNEVIAADSIIYVNYYQVFAQFDLTGHTPGTYDVSAVNFCEGEAVLANGFTIEDGQPSGLSYNLLFPSSPRPNRNVVMMLEYGNTGNVDLRNQVLEITSIGGCPIALTSEGLSLQQTVLRVPLSIEGEPQGLLRPGSYGTLNIYGFTSGALIFTIKPVQE